MIFISLAKFRKKPTKEPMAETNRLFAKLPELGGKILSAYWTLGRYDAVVIIEGPDEKAAMKGLISFGDLVSTETLVAVPAEEARKFVE